MRIPFPAICLLFFLKIPFQADAQSEAWRSKIEPRLWQQVESGEPAEFLVILQAQADLRGAESIRPKAAKGRYVFEMLQALAENTQPPLRALLKSAGAPCQSFWVINALWSSGSMELITRLAQLPEVARVEANPVWHLSLPPQTQAETVVQDRVLTPISWGLTKVNADDVWAMGYKGSGVVVGGQDTGYEWNHPALRTKYRGWNGSSADHNYNWHDAIHALIGGGSNSCGLNLTAPCDDDFHGTHTMGTMTGGVNDDSIVGVAPEAKWMGCRNMEEGDGTPSTYIECFQWFIAPTNLSNGSPDPAQAPDVINNSWGCPSSEGCNATNFATMETVVNSVRSAGILVVTSAGNSGPGCSTVNDPPSIFTGSFAVGATNSNDGIAGFSSRGPVTVYGPSHSKPDVSAPGVGIPSCVGSSNTTSTYGYASYSGTSMAGPHVAGVAALIMSARPDLKGQVTLLENLLKNNAVPLYASAPFCGGNTATSLPNNVYGYGRVDALAAVNAALALPVDLVEFSAYKAGVSTKIQWQTVSESDCDRFEIQRSSDGLQWQGLGSLACSGSSSTGKNYFFTDAQPQKGLNYYRLKQVDRSGSAGFSVVVSVYFGSGVGLRVVGKPWEQSAYFEVLGGLAEGLWQLEWYAADGRLIQQYQVGQTGSLALPVLSSGLYAVLLRDERGQVLAVEKVIW